MDSCLTPQGTKRGQGLKDGPIFDKQPYNCSGKETDLELWYSTGPHDISPDDMIGVLAMCACVTSALAPSVK